MSHFLGSLVECFAITALPPLPPHIISVLLSPLGVRESLQGAQLPRQDRAGVHLNLVQSDVEVKFNPFAVQMSQATEKTQLPVKVPKVPL